MSPILESIGSVKGFGWGALVAGGSFESIATVSSVGGESSLSFTSIPSTYKSLQIRWTSRVNSGGTTAESLWMRFNSDTGNNYNFHSVYGTGSAAESNNDLNQERIYSLNSNAGSGVASNIFGVGIMNIYDYSSTTKFKTTRAFCGCDANVSNSNFRVVLNSNLWRSTSAITSISMFGSSTFAADSTFSLYGIKG